MLKNWPQFFFGLHKKCVNQKKTLLQQQSSDQMMLGNKRFQSFAQKVLPRVLHETSVTLFCYPNKQKRFLDQFHISIDTLLATEFSAEWKIFLANATIYVCVVQLILQKLALSSQSKITEVKVRRRSSKPLLLLAVNNDKRPGPFHLPFNSR